MNIPPFWVREKREMPELPRGCARLRGVSAVSMEEARRRMEEQADMFRTLVSADGELDWQAAKRQYTAEVLEPVAERWDEHNIVTRNRYGALVLNSDDLCFADVDAPPRSLGQTLLGLFGAGASDEQLLLDCVRRLCAADESLGVRVYRTAQGFRLIMAGQGITLGSARTAELFRAVHADPLYVRLCAKQESWRARLSPKPARVGVKRPPAVMASDAAAATLADWLPGYEAACADYSVCRLVECVGRPIHHPAAERHDAATGARLRDRRLA